MHMRLYPTVWSIATRKITDLSMCWAVLGMDDEVEK